MKCIRENAVIHRAYDGKLTKSVFRKTSNALKTLSYKSNHPQAHKKELCQNPIQMTGDTLQPNRSQRRRIPFPQTTILLQWLPVLIRSENSAETAFAKLTKQLLISSISPKQWPVSSSHTKSELPVA